MSTATALDQQITDYLILLSDKQKEAVLTVVKTFAGDEEYYEYDEDLMQDLDKRLDAYKNGATVVSEEEVRQKMMAIAQQDGKI